METLEVYKEYFNYVLGNENLHLPPSAAEASELYLKLVRFASFDN